jgi:hypothetical protein
MAQPPDAQWKGAAGSGGSEQLIWRERLQTEVLWREQHAFEPLPPQRQMVSVIRMDSHGGSCLSPILLDSKDCGSVRLMSMSTRPKTEDPHDSGQRCA